MKRKSIGLLSVAITTIAALSFSLSSCDNNDNGPTTPGNGGVDRSKGPQVLGGKTLTSIGFKEVGLNEASLSRNADGEIIASGMTGDEQGIETTFDDPISYWNAGVDVTFPATGGSLSYESRDVDGAAEARVDLVEKNGIYAIEPTFTSAVGAGTPQYDVIIQDNDRDVIRVDGITAGKHIEINPLDCIIRVTTVSWGVYSVLGQCQWKLRFNPCCTLQFKLPDGTTYSGNAIKLIERNTNGVYVYINTGIIATTGNVAAYTIRSASASNS